MAKATKASTKKRSSKKASAKKSGASKGAAARKKPARKTAKKAASKATRKPAAKKASRKPAKKTSTRKAATKRSARKTAAKKAAKKPARKPAAKKTARKPAKKSTARKPAKKAAAKKTARKPAKKPAAKKPAAKKATRAKGAAKQATWNALGSRAAAPAAPVAADQKQAPKKFQRQYKTWLQRLIGLRRRLLGETTALEEEALRAAERDVSIDHMADHGSDSYEQEFTLSQIESKSEALRDVDEAIRKIELGTYGLCEDCETLIPKGRLEVLPHTRLCIECKSAQESASGF